FTAGAEARREVRSHAARARDCFEGVRRLYEQGDGSHAVDQRRHCQSSSQQDLQQGGHVEQARVGPVRDPSRSGPQFVKIELHFSLTKSLSNIYENRGHSDTSPWIQRWLTCSELSITSVGQPALFASSGAAVAVNDWLPLVSTLKI